MTTILELNKLNRPIIVHRGVHCGFLAASERVDYFG